MTNIKYKIKLKTVIKTILNSRIFVLVLILFTVSACSEPELTVKNAYNRMSDQWAAIGEDANRLQRNFMFSGKTCARVEREIAQVNSLNAAAEKPMESPKLLIYSHQNFCGKMKKIADASAKVFENYRLNQHDFNAYYQLVIDNDVSADEAGAEMKIFEKKYKRILDQISQKKNEFAETVANYNNNIDQLNAFYDSQESDKVTFKGEKIILSN